MVDGKKKVEDLSKESQLMEVEFLMQSTTQNKSYNMMMFEEIGLFFRVWLMILE